MEIIKENLRRCDAFYQSDFYHFLEETDPAYIPYIFEHLCEDPDASDKSLYQELGEKFSLPARASYLLDRVDGEKIRLAADVICGRKQIVEHHKQDFQKWRADYERVRSNLHVHFLWPKHKAPTINTFRYTVYLDRIDCLLYDLKLYFAGKETPMQKAYQNGTTPLWLKQFDNDFQVFIDQMKLGAYVNEHYEVLDISRGTENCVKSDFITSGSSGFIK